MVLYHSFVISILLFLLAVALSWGFAQGLPQEVHNNRTIFPNLGAGFVSLPLIAILISFCVAIDVERKDCEYWWALCARIGVFLCGGLCSLVGGILLYVGAATPPPPDVFNPQGYSAFAAITYCFALCGCSIWAVSDDKEESVMEKNCMIYRIASLVV